MIDWLKQAPPSVEVAGRSLPLTIRRLPQARRLTMRLAPDGSEVRISMPRWARTAEAVEFARSRTAWIEAQLGKVAPPREPGRGDAVPYRGQPYRIEHVPARPRRPELLTGAILLGGPEVGLSGRLRRWLEGEARELFAADLVEYCTRADKPAPRLLLSRAQRRWGSCAPDGTIRLNWRLVMAPDFVRRSVVAHEVAHLVHMDHSPRFHALLDQLYEGEIAVANHWLKREGRGLYLPFG
jgi:predicted metal-dependent hydrolase